MLARHAGELRRRGIATTTVGVGQDFDEGLLSAMAEAGGGNFQYVADPEGLRAFFAYELQELFSVAATGLAVTLVLAPGVDAELVSAFPADAAKMRSRSPSVTSPPATRSISSSPSALSRQCRDLLPVGVTACWTDPRADARGEVNAALEPLRRVEEGEVTAATPDDLVVERAARQRAAAERRAGLELDRAGRFAESRARMRRSQDPGGRADDRRGTGRFRGEHGAGLRSSDKRLRIAYPQISAAPGDPAPPRPQGLSPNLRLVAVERGGARPLVASACMYNTVISGKEGASGMGAVRGPR